MTHRQCLTWNAWLILEWSQPSRSDNYLMQIACEIRRVLCKKPNKIQMKHFQLKFGEVRKPRYGDLPPEQRAHIANASKSRWMGFMGKSIKRIEVPNSAMNGNQFTTAKGNT